MEGDTTSLRNAAPNWNLAGDKQLLGMLQQIHQSIMTKCQEANAKLEAMVDALDNASIDLQNVNNKFMALSNSQFVESRVYDDDVDIKTDESTAKQEAPKLQENDIEKIKRSLQKLEMMHEPVLIMDSDSSDDEESSVVLKPKDVYEHRPVPYIIGSQAWKNKWHAGLLLEDSDSDSGSSLYKREIEPAEEYSDSEPEVPADVTDKHAQRTISSSSMESEVLSRSSPPRAPSAPAGPAAVAAELARRLAGHAHLPVTAPETTLSPPEPTTTKVYGMDKPTPATIFPNEPPPLDSIESDNSDDDIFAELHKKPNQNSFRDSNRTHFGANNIVEELFGGHSEKSNDIGKIVPDYGQPSSSLRESSSVDELLGTNSHREKSTNKPTSSINDTNIKKPIGGISLFGSNKGAESIGAAILKRHQRKSTSDEDGSDVTESQVPVKETIKENKKIIEELFTKPTAKKKDTKVIVNKERDNVKPIKDKVEVKATDKIDLFSDNIFDDIDDIFTTNVTKPKINKKTKSIFDDDDLFSDVVESTKPQAKEDTKSIFDSEDDLFTDNDIETSINSKTKTSSVKADTILTANTSKTTKENIKVKSIFDDNSDDDLFSEIANKTKPILEVKEEKQSKSQFLKSVDSEIKSTEEATSPNNLFSNKNNINADQNTNKSNNKPTNNSMLVKSPNLFDDDDDDIDDLFSINAEQKVVKTPQKNAKVFSSSGELNDVNSSDVNVNAEMKISDSEELPEQNKNNDIKEIIQSPIITNTVDNFDVNISRNEIENENKKRSECLKENEVIKTKSNEELNYDNKESECIPEEPLFSEKATESKEPDLFSDIFNDLPPAFEKPSESKKSKNVNALFDDDSDDETLFFKKNDVISDEKPDLDFSSDRFRIFHDEPPDIDVDFSQKPLKNTTSDEKPIDELFDEISQIENLESKYDEEQVISLPNKVEQDTIEKRSVETVDITKLIEDFSEPDTKEEDVNISKLLEDNKSDKDQASSDNDETNNLKSGSKLEEKIQNIEQNKTLEYESKDQTNSSEEDSIKKPIGKLKPMNFNINVNTLIPGASPKKDKANEELDGQILSTKSNEEININANDSNSKMLKSVSFDGDPDSKVLDNKLSKDRVKIQVKRRPSTRRARLEAVRKSGIEFGSDSTDNSSSFDEPKPKESINDEIKTSTQKDTVETKETHLQHIDPPITNNTPKEISVSKIEQSDDVSNKIKPEVKSKIVYILNDEDIFSDSSQNTERENVEGNIKTIGQTYKESSNIQTVSISKDTKVKDRKPLFDDLSDEELFGDKKSSQQKTRDSIFNSDREAELFSKSSAKPDEKKKNVARASLFGDESDDDNLFASKTSKTSDKKPTPPNQSTNKPTEVVFEDPLSLFGEDDS